MSETSFFPNLLPYPLTLPGLVGGSGKHEYIKCNVIRYFMAHRRKQLCNPIDSNLPSFNNLSSYIPSPSSFPMSYLEQVLYSLYEWNVVEAYKTQLFMKRTHLCPGERHELLRKFCHRLSFLWLYQKIKKIPKTCLKLIETALSIGPHHGITFSHCQRGQEKFWFLK